MASYGAGVNQVASTIYYNTGTHGVGAMYTCPSGRSARLFVHYHPTAGNISIRRNSSSGAVATLPAVSSMASTLESSAYILGPGDQVYCNATGAIGFIATIIETRPAGS